MGDRCRVGRLARGEGRALRVGVLCPLSVFAGNLTMLGRRRAFF
jgi:hypothetical protein